MNYINENLIRKILHELSDKFYQQRVWLASEGTEISSFEESISQLFDDSGLDLAIQNGEVFGAPVDNLLKQLGAFLDEISVNRSPEKIINDPKMNNIRDISSQILKILEKQ